MEHTGSEVDYHDLVVDDNAKRALSWFRAVVTLAIFTVVSVYALMLAPVAVDAPLALAELLPGSVVPGFCAVGSELACLAGGCPLVDSYMLRVEPWPSNFSVDPVWGGSHITMSSHEHPYDREAALAKWNRLMLMLPLELNFSPSKSDWNAETNICDSAYGCKMLVEGGSGAPWNALHAMGLAIEKAHFLNARISGFHITIAGKDPQGCEVIRDEVHSLARHFADGSWVLVLLHIGTDGTIYRLRQRLISSIS